MRILIADDEALFAEAVETLLAADGRVEVVARAADGRRAVELALELEPDVVLMDLRMPELDGFAATRQITGRSARTRVLVLSGSDNPADVAEARRAGAAGYLTKDRIAETLVDAILRAGAAELP